MNYVLISSKPGEEHEAYNKLIELPDIIELHPLFGEYDLIAKVIVPDGEDIGDYVAKIKKTEEVIGTKTLTGIPF